MKAPAGMSAQLGGGDVERRDLAVLRWWRHSGGTVGRDITSAHATRREEDCSSRQRIARLDVSV